MLWTDTQGHMNSMVMLKFWIIDSFPSQTATHFAAYIIDTVCVCLLASSVEPSD